MAPAAEPILASALWKPHPARKQSPEGAPKRKRLVTGCHTIDTALRNGLDHGSISCISGEPDTGIRELIQALLVSQLLSSAATTATIIDTGLSLDVRKLHQALTSRMSDRSNASEQAAKLLDRVKIMKVFDFVGLTESLAEVRDELEGKPTPPPNPSPRPASNVPRGTIGDSEDEDEDELLAPRTIQLAPSTTTKPPPAEPTLLIISTLSLLTLPLLKSNYVSGQALLTSFMRSLTHLTTRHNICTVLTNGVMWNNKRDETPSIFSSCALQPTLGRAFGYALDVYLLVHSMAKGTTDGGEGKEKVEVLEVLHDRYGDRVGRWAAFTVDDADADRGGGGGLISVS